MSRLLSVLLACFVAFSSFFALATATGEEPMQYGVSYLHHVENMDMAKHAQQGCCTNASQHDSYHCMAGCNTCVAAKHFNMIDCLRKRIRLSDSFPVSKPYHPNDSLKRPPKFV